MVGLLKINDKNVQAAAEIYVEGFLVYSFYIKNKFDEINTSKMLYLDLNNN